MQIAARLAIQGPATDQRRAVRFPVSMETDMRQIGYHGFDVVVRDISALGFKVETPIRIKVKTLVGLRLPGIGMVLGRVAWCRKGCVGGEFVNPIPEQRLRQVVGYPRLSVVQSSHAGNDSSQI